MNNTNSNIIRNSKIYDKLLLYFIILYNLLYNIILIYYIINILYWGVQNKYSGSFILLVYKIEPCNEVRQRSCCDIKNTTVKDMDFE